MIKKEHKINPIPNYIDITKVDITKWEDGLYTLGLDKDKGLVILEKPIFSSTGDIPIGDGSRALYNDGTYKPTYDKEGIDKLLEGYSKTGHKHNPEDINLNSSNRFVTDTEKSKWNTASTNATNIKKIVENIKMSGSTTSLLNNGEIIIPTIAGPKGEKGDKGDKGNDGKDGTGVNILGALSSDSQLPTIGTKNDAYLIDGVLYVYVGSGGDTAGGKWQNAGDIKGPKGDDGDTGPKGDDGDTGPKGDDGADGKDGFNPQWKTIGSTILVASNGERDLKGPKGDTGAKGADGDKGDTGPQGLKGDTGAKGLKGDTGPQGLKGDTGAKGDTGPQGLKGDTGAKGDTGPAGKDGFNPYWKTTGSTILVANNGERDLKGAKGDKGDTGAKGDTGLKGDTGDVGKSAYQVWLDEGNTGTISAYLDSLKGDKGDTGEQGNQGEKGDKGDAGSDANVTKDNVEIALGYTPLPQSGGLLNDYVEKLVIIGEINSINLDEGNTFSKTISADTTFSIDNAKAGAHSFTLIIEMDTLSALTFPTEVKWQDGEAPDMSEANKTYILTFLTIDNGLTWFGMKGGAF